MLSKTRSHVALNTRSIVALLVVLALHVSVLAQSQNVLALTDVDFDQNTAEGVWLIEFFAPWYICLAWTSLC